MPASARSRRDCGGAREAAARRLGWSDRCGDRHGRRKRGILGQNGALEPLELRPGLEPELAGEQPAAVAVDLQRVALPATAIEREHRLATQALAQRIRGDERVELSDELAVATELQERFDPVFRRREPEIVETADLVTREVLEGELGERRASPERERLVEQPCGLGG